MRNPRPCWACRRPESAHPKWYHAYEGVKRTEPLRAKRTPLYGSVYVVRMEPLYDAFSAKAKMWRPIIAAVLAECATLAGRDVGTDHPA